MLFDLLASTDIAADLIERTSSTARVQEILSLSLAPAFLLAGIGATMNVMMGRLIWIAGRIERLETRLADDRSEKEQRELVRLRRRRRLAQHAIKFSTAAALSICVVIAVLFVSALIQTQIGVVIAICWIAAMVFLITGLVLFLTETMVAAAGQTKASDRDEGS
ncbi:MAG: DUF2721 domain-containing protein [Erythrobacter sp.]